MARSSWEDPLAKTRPDPSRVRLDSRGLADASELESRMRLLSMCGPCHRNGAAIFPQESLPPPSGIVSHRSVACCLRGGAQASCKGQLGDLEELAAREQPQRGPSNRSYYTSCHTIHHPPIASMYQLHRTNPASAGSNEAALSMSLSAEYFLTTVQSTLLRWTALRLECGARLATSSSSVETGCSVCSEYCEYFCSSAVCHNHIGP